MPSCRRLALISALISALLAAALAGPVRALDEDRNLPFSINAAAVDLDQKTGRALYRGNVVLSQGSMRLEADRVEVQTDERRRLATVIATGRPVRLRVLLQDREDELLANAERIVFRVEAREVELSGNAWVRQGTDEFNAQHMTYGLDARRLSANGVDNDDGRVHAIFHPKSKSESPER